MFYSFSSSFPSLILSLDYHFHSLFPSFCSLYLRFFPTVFFFFFLPYLNLISFSLCLFLSPSSSLSLTHHSLSSHPLLIRHCLILGFLNRFLLLSSSSYVSNSLSLLSLYFFFVSCALSLPFSLTLIHVLLSILLFYSFTLFPPVLLSHSFLSLYFTLRLCLNFHHSLSLSLNQDSHPFIPLTLLRSVLLSHSSFLYSISLSSHFPSLCLHFARFISICFFIPPLPLI